MLPTGATRGGDISADSMPEVTPPPAPPSHETDQSVQVEKTQETTDLTPIEAEINRAPAAEPATAPRTVVVTRPVRAGKQVYADKGADLIVMATVNPGAEIIADGHIHIYGALRGRAIAGAAGYEDARIFASHFDPELVAIAGLYRVREDLDPALIGESVQLSLDGDFLRVDRLSNRS